MTKLGFDIDDTIADSVGYYLPLLNKKFNKSVTINDVDGRLTDVYNLPQYMLDEFFQSFGNEIFQDLVPFPKSVDTINKWYDNGQEITIITARPITAKETTENWLKKHGIKYHQIFFDEEKSKLAKSIGIEIFADDHPKVAEAMNDVGIRSLFMDVPKNLTTKTSENLLRVKNWSEVEEIIDKLIK